MFNKKNAFVALLILCVAALQNCSKKDDATGTTIATLDLPAAPYNYSNIAFPPHIATALAANDNTPVGNPITDNGATLGRVLFYDKNLSKNNTISCASCHKQANSFTDNVQFSKGFDGGVTTRNSMALLNVRFYKSGKMFWDERSNTLEDQILQPIQNHVEMGMTLTDLVAKLKTLDYYPDLFTRAFGTSTIDTIRISRSVAQFLRSIVTYQAKYDRVKQGLEAFTTDERDGEQLFLAAGGPTGPGGITATCAACHTPPEFLTSQPAGPFALQDANDLGILNQNRFKVGSLRNITTGTLLFHNGSVLDVPTMLASNIPAHGVAPADRQKLFAFLQTLTDNSVTSDVRFSNPFR